jgi:hypothetical protein
MKYYIVGLSSQWNVKSAYMGSSHVRWFHTYDFLALSVPIEYERVLYLVLRCLCNPLFSPFQSKITSGAASPAARTSPTRSPFPGWRRRSGRRSWESTFRIPTGCRNTGKKTGRLKSVLKVCLHEQWFWVPCRGMRHTVRISSNLVTRPLRDMERHKNSCSCK